MRQLILSASCVLLLLACSSPEVQVRSAATAPTLVGDTMPVIREQDHLDHMAKQAEAGDAQAALWLSQHYAARDEFASAARWKQKAAKFGHPLAQPPRRPISAEAAQYIALSQCTASRLRPFVARSGPNKAWPILESFPPHLAHSAGELIYGPGESAAGITYTLYIDMSSRAAYVLQRGGPTDDSTVYGPLPIASCPEPPPNNSSKPTPLRGAA